ncbi:Amt family ammonium transporter [Desulfobaculum xiamenense]|uniref:Ammonium transporter n=1 Tax=Desulfobaculum xiamenense TaxID=995050 RepID=A0A846QM14_9BACT|nr:ammonium transporter [Desulfobaculum xiamenense]NJB68227.1 Amt family ammonium transporter [Desulfobaculum xiamenense]
MSPFWFSPKRPLSVPFLAATLLAVLATLPHAAHAAEGTEALSQFNANILWTLIAAILVMFMQAGFAMVETGFTRAKNAGNIIMKNFLDFSAGSVAFFLVGFGLMFGGSIAGLLGGSDFALIGVDATTPEGMWTLTFWFFQSVFAATSATIVSGGVAERMKFPAYITVSMIVTALIYPVSGHWCWGGLWGTEGGWLERIGFIDFAGSTVVHSVGGWLALAGALAVGPRVGKYNDDGSANAIRGHNLPLASLGVFILWFGWFGFNPGSTTVADGTIGYIAVNTSLAGAAGALGAMITAWTRYGHPDPSMTLNGALAGLVAITAGCFELSPIGSLITGFGGGVLVVLSVVFIDTVLRIDDPVGAVSVHGVCGAYGTLMVGLMAAPGYGSNVGLLYGGGFGLLTTQLIGVGAVFCWAFGMGVVTFAVVKAVMGLRVKENEELRGLDIVEHGTESYGGFQIFTTE